MKWHLVASDMLYLQGERKQMECIIQLSGLLTPLYNNNALSWSFSKQTVSNLSYHLNISKHVLASNLYCWHNINGYTFYSFVLLEY